MAKITDNEWAERWLNQQVYFSATPERIYLVTAVNLRERTIFVGEQFVKPSEVHRIHEHTSVLDK